MQQLRLRDYVYLNDLDTAESVMNELEQWFEDYNHFDPHKGQEDAFFERI